MHSTPTMILGPPDGSRRGSAMTVRAGRTARVGAMVLAAVLTVAGCGGPDPVAAPTEAGIAPAASPTPGAPQESAADAVADEAADEGVAAAVVGMRAFTARSLPYEQWWAQLSPLLTPDAQWLYEAVDPWKVPASAVTDDGQVASTPDSTYLVALVGTDIGQYRVELARQSVEHPWLVHVITPPEALS